MSNLNEKETLERIRQNNAAESAKKEKRTNTVKNLTIYGLVLTLVTGATWDLAKNGSKYFKLPTKPSTTQTQTQENKWTREYFEGLVSDYILSNPNVDEDVARHFLAIQYQDELMKYNPELLYELTGIYEYEELTDEKFEKLVSDTYKTLRANGVNVTVEDVTKFVAVINIDQLAQDNPELLKRIIGTDKASEFITDAFKVTGAIKNRNYDIYKTTKSTDSLIRVSDFIFDKRAREDLILIESYVDRAHMGKGNKTQQNALVNELMDNIQRPDGKLADMEDGVGFASTVAFDSLINYVTFNNNNVRIISNQNFSALMNHDSLELYLPNIYGVINECNTKKLTK